METQSSTMPVAGPAHALHPTTHSRPSLLSHGLKCSLHLDVGWFQEEAGVLLQDVHQWQGKDTAEAGGEEPGFPVHIHGWPQRTVGRVKRILRVWDCEGSGQGSVSPLHLFPTMQTL